ncbi:MAG: copper-binding protein [Limnohabitans sp.]|nr:copper-binding protein [Limnohabitans sp.]
MYHCDRKFLMNFLQKLPPSSVLILLCCIALPALADTGKFMAEGVVRKLDPENRKITIKHGDIKNLQMLGMTMVFRLQETVNIDKLLTGDKVLFHAEKIDGAFVITDLQGSP